MKPVLDCDTDQAAIDTEMMRRCIRLSASAAAEGEFPFAAVISDGAMVVAEAVNRVAQNGDVTQHAELLAVAKAQQVLGRKDLSTCTIYSNVEPCAMCSFPIRETRIARVVYAISSPLMGGFSRWNVLRDAEISNVMPEAFGPIPEVIAGTKPTPARHTDTNWLPAPAADAVPQPALDLAMRTGRIVGRPTVSGFAGHGCDLCKLVYCQNDRSADGFLRGRAAIGSSTGAGAAALQPIAARGRLNRGHFSG
jgi:tRNA(adenine34) deaminase